MLSGYLGFPYKIPYRLYSLGVIRSRLIGFFCIAFLFSKVSFAVAAPLSLQQEVELDSFLKQERLELVASEREALSELVSLWLEDNEFTDESMSQLQQHLWPEFRLPPEDAARYLKHINSRTDIEDGAKQFISHQILIPHMLDVGLCRTSPGSPQRECTFAWATPGVDLKGISTSNPLSIVPKGSPLDTIFSIMHAEGQTVLGSYSLSLAGACQSADELFDSSRQNSFSLISIVTDHLRSLLDVFVSEAAAQVDPESVIDAGVDCVDLGEVVVVSVSRDYLSFGSGYSAWGEWSGAYSAKYLSTNSDSLGLVLPFAAECNLSCLLHALTTCGGAAWLVENQLFETFLNEEANGKEDVLVCAAKKVRLKSRNLRDTSQMSHKLSGSHCNTMPVPVETSPLFQQIRDKEYSQTFYGSKFSAKLGTHAQYRSPYVSAPITGSNMYPLPSANSIDEGRLDEFYWWKHIFGEVRSQAFNMIYATSQSANSNRSCRVRFSHPVRPNYQVWGDSAWTWYGSYSGSEKWGLPEVSWIAGYYSGHPPRVCSVPLGEFQYNF